MCINIIDKYRQTVRYIYLSLYNVGKEELLVMLAKYYDTKVLVTHSRYLVLLASCCDMSLFLRRTDY